MLLIKLVKGLGGHMPSLYVRVGSQGTIVWQKLELNGGLLWLLANMWIIFVLSDGSDQTSKQQLIRINPM